MGKAGSARAWRGGAPLLVAGLLGVLGGCDNVLGVDERGIITPADLDRAGPQAVPTLLHGVVGAYHSAVDGITRYAALLTDEMILSGTFPTRLQVDNRRILPDNANVTGMYTAVHQARFQADTIAFVFEGRLGDPAFSQVADDLREGIVLGKLYGGYTRLWLAELFCWSILTGLHPESSPQMPDQRMADALDFLEQAEARASAEGLTSARLAAIVGQARAHLWRGNYGLAGSLASQVPRDFAYWAEYSNNDPSQYNGMYVFTWGDTEAIRWTVGDGTWAARGNERWEHFDEFVRLNLLRNRPPDFRSMQGSIPVVLQMLYNRPEAGVLVGSGVEARLIEAEVAVREGRTEAAEALLNDLRADFSLRANFRRGIPPPLPQNQLQGITLTGDLQEDLKRVADERARELWLTGDRHTTSRRLRWDPALDIDLFPPVKAAIGGGDDIAFPMVERELQNNPNLSRNDACPPGQQPGSWR